MEPTIIFIGILVFGLSFKYLLDNCKNSQDDILFITTDNINNINNEENQDNEVPPKYEDIYNN